MTTTGSDSGIISDSSLYHMIDHQDIPKYYILLEIPFTKKSKDVCINIYCNTRSKEKKGRGRGGADISTKDENVLISYLHFAEELPGKLNNNQSSQNGMEKSLLHNEN